MFGVDQLLTEDQSVRFSASQPMGRTPGDKFWTTHVCLYCL